MPFVNRAPNLRHVAKSCLQGKKPLPHIFDMENIVSAIFVDIKYLAFEIKLTCVIFTLVKALLKTLLEFMGILLLLHSKC